MIIGCSIESLCKYRRKAYQSIKALLYPDTFLVHKLPYTEVGKLTAVT